MACGGQRGAAGGDDDGGCAVLACNVCCIHQVACAARVGDDDHTVTRTHQRGTHHLHVAVAVGDGSDTQPEEFVLGIQCHDARVAHAKKLHPPPGLVGGGQGHNGFFQRSRAGVVAVLQKGRHGVVDDLDQHIAGFVVRIHTAVDKRHPFTHAARQLELEVAEPVVPHAAAKPHYRGFADVGAGGQFTHRQVGKGPGVDQHECAHTLLGGRQRA